MKGYILFVTIIVLLIFVILAYKKPEIEVNYPIPDFKSFMPKPQKAKKSKTPGSREEKCRDIFEALTGKAFPTKRPAFLKNPKTGRNLELDGYCAELNLAFEHNGKQHYEFPNSFHKTRDKYKRKTCKSLGIKLVNIPYDIPENELLQYIKRKSGL